MQNLWPICKCCFWGYLFPCIPRARWGMLVYCCLGYLILSLSVTCNSFFFLKGFENDLRWPEELPFGFHVSPAKLLHIHFVTIRSTRSFSAGLLPRKSGPSLHLCMGTKLSEVEGLCWINEVPDGPFLQTVKVPQLSPGLACPSVFSSHSFLAPSFPPSLLQIWSLIEINMSEWKHLHIKANTFKTTLKKAFPSWLSSVVGILEKASLLAVTPLPLHTRSC